MFDLKLLLRFREFIFSGSIWVERMTLVICGAVLGQNRGLHPNRLHPEESPSHLMARAQK